MSTKGANKSAPVNEKKDFLSTQIVWARVLIIGLLHVAGIYGYFIRGQAKFSSEVYGRILTILCSFSVTAAAHRLWSHQSYKANKAFQVLFMFFMCLIYQNSIYVWVRDHRVHHKFVETDADPYNAKRGFFFSHVGWLMVRKHRDVKEKGKCVNLDDLHKNPVVMFQHNHYHKLIIICNLIFMIFIPCYCFGESFLVAFFYMNCYRMIAILNITWGINSFAHLYGSKPYSKNKPGTHTWIMEYLGLGEGFHNYHHTFPWDYKASEFNSDSLNSTTMLIDFFARLGWVTDRRTVDTKTIQEYRKEKGDGDDVKNPQKSPILNGIRFAFLCVLFGYVI